MFKVFFMKKRVSLLCAGALMASLTQSAYTMNLTDDVYGRVNVSLGYNIQKYTGDDFKDLINAWKDELGTKTNKYNHALTIGVGYNFYLKVNDRFNPFVGFEALGRIPLTGNKIVDANLTDAYGDPDVLSAKFNEYFIFHGKFGGKVNIYKDIAVAPYAMIGFNVAQYKVKDESTELFNKTKVGISTGAGVETLFKVMNQEFSAGIEYRFTMNKFTTEYPERLRFYTHNLMVKFGYHFL